MDYGKYTVIYETPDIRRKICKIWYGADGSYYVSSPYHPEQKAILTKITVNYTTSATLVALENSLDLADLDDKEHRLKFSHHPDGFAQFSGHGILSGRNADGTARGMGVMTWPLDVPIRGPAFGLAIQGIEHFTDAESMSSPSVVFRHDELTPASGLFGLMLEGYYFPGLWRRFVRVVSDGTKVIRILHPAKAILELKVLLSSPQCRCDGFLGVELYTLPTPPSESQSISFIFSGPTGNVRQNLDRQIVADGIYCLFPHMPIPAHRNLNYYMDSVPGSE